MRGVGIGVLVRLLALFLAILISVGHWSAPGSALALAQEARTALVIGNGDYSFAPLANPTNDAGDVAEALRKAGFEVTLLKDADIGETRTALRTFGQVLKEKGGVGLFFFAGHGVQVKGENYLLPVGDGIGDVDDLDNQTVSAAQIVEEMDAANNALNIVILDACRDNPFTGGTKGLSRIDSSSSLFVSYSTSPGSVALDGTGRNSPYTANLTRALETPGLNLEETFKRTLKGVYQETRGKQLPWLSSSFFGEFVFLEGQASPGSTAAAPSGQRQALSLSRQPAIAETASLAGIYRAEGRNPNGSRYNGMVALAQDGDRFDVTWWIGRQVFHGTGQLAGRMLVVDWGAQHPVVYSFAGEGRLNGEWADGSASERLTPVGIAASGAVPKPGRYAVQGRNPNGSGYKGWLNLDGDGERYELSWKIGRDSYSGSGIYRNGLLIVDWGGATPVIYALEKNGSLSGLWEAGRGAERLTPEG
ncbi:MAG: caspase family protein [Nitratireductor sp.]|nr:caspase family protein [Nitratireductor sp.]